MVTEAIPGVDGRIDHRLIISEMRIRLQPRKRPQGKRPTDNPRSNRPRRRTPLVDREGTRHKVDIAELSGTRSRWGEVDNGYIFRNEHSNAEQRNAGVTFGIQNEIVGRLYYLPQATNDRPMSLRMPLQVSNFATIISAYAPTVTGSEEAKTKFYEDLHVLLESVPKVVSVAVFGDFNVRVEADWPVSRNHRLKRECPPPTNLC
ncbi:hypothetical protein SprV_0902657400 [Sparganum proliferum]